MIDIPPLWQWQTPLIRKMTVTDVATQVTGQLNVQISQTDTHVVVTNTTGVDKINHEIDMIVGGPTIPETVTTEESITLETEMRKEDTTPKTEMKGITPKKDMMEVGTTPEAEKIEAILDTLEKKTTMEGHLIHKDPERDPHLTTITGKNHRIPTTKIGLGLESTIPLMRILTPLSWHWSGNQLRQTKNRPRFLSRVVPELPEGRPYTSSGE